VSGRSCAGKKQKFMLMKKKGEFYFLKIVEAEGGYRSAVWVWDTYPGERQKGLPVFISEYAGKHATVKDAKKYFLEQGFEFECPSKGTARWLDELKLEERLAKFMEERAGIEKRVQKGG